MVPGLIFDTTLVSQAPPKLTDNTLDFGIKGLFHRVNQSESQFSSSIETLPEHTEVVDPKFQFFISDASMNSYLFSLPNVTSMHEIFTSNEEFFDLDTTSLDQFFPGMK